MECAHVPSLAEVASLLMISVVLGVVFVVLVATWVWLLEVLQRRWKRIKHRMRAARARPEEQSGSPSAGSPTAHGDVGKPRPTQDKQARAVVPSRECVSPRAPLAAMDSLVSLSGSSSSPRGSLYSFPEPWLGAMEELAALQHPGCPQSPKAVEETVGQPGPALGQETPLELPGGTEQERVPTDSRDRAQSPVDVEMSPSSATATAREKGELILEFLRTLQDIQAMAKQCCELLQELQAQEQGAARACGGTPPGEPSHALARMETQHQVGLQGASVRLQHLGAELPGKEVAMDKEKPVGPGRSGSMVLERSSPRESGRRSLMDTESSNAGQGRRSPMAPNGEDRTQSPMDAPSPPGRPPAMARGKGERIIQLVYALQALQAKREQHWEQPESSSPTELDWRDRGQSPMDDESPPGSPPAMATEKGALLALQEKKEQRHEPMGRERGWSARGCLWNGCARLWHRLKDWWRRSWWPHSWWPRCLCFSKHRWWQRLSQKTNELLYD